MRFPQFRFITEVCSYFIAAGMWVRIRLLNVLSWSRIRRPLWLPFREQCSRGGNNPSHPGWADMLIPFGDVVSAPRRGVTRQPGVQPPVCCVKKDELLPEGEPQWVRQVHNSVKSPFLGSSRIYQEILRKLRMTVSEASMSCRACRGISTMCFTQRALHHAIPVLRSRFTC